jgi:hypothetical protein
MSQNVKPVDKNALLGDESKHTNKVYVSPTTGKSSNKPTADSVGVPRTTWWRANPDGEPSSPIFSTPKVKEMIKLEAAEISVYFPDFDLCETNEATFWLGRIDGIGEVRITYPATYPAQKIEVEALDLSEGFNEELKKIAWSYDGIRPAGAIIITMRLFLLRKEA